MFVVTVYFTIRNGKAEAFMGEMKQQARNSLRLESGCHLFDVCVDEEDEHRIFLYEIYASRAAFDDHMASEHYQAFAGVVSPWVDDKKVEFWSLRDVGK